MRTVQRFFIVFLSSFFITYAAYAGAGVAGSQTMIAVVDFDAVFTSSKVGMDMKKRLDEKRDFYKKDIEKRKESWSLAFKKLSAEKEVIAPEVYAKREQKLSRELQIIEKLKQGYGGILDGMRASFLDQIRKNLDKVIKDLVAKDSIDFILPASSLIYYAQSANITDRVLPLLDKKIQTVNLTGFSKDSLAPNGKAWSSMSLDDIDDLLMGMSAPSS